MDKVKDDEIGAWIKLYEFVKGCIHGEDGSFDYTYFVDEGRKYFNLKEKQE